MRERSFWDKNFGVKILVGALFVFFLFSLLHFRETHVEVLELNSIAPSYIVAQVDMDFFDEEATIILKQDAVKDIGKIYQIADKDVRQARNDFENFLINRGWKDKEEGTSFEELYEEGDVLKTTLLQTRFTSPRTLHKIKETSLPTTYYLVYTPANREEPVVFPEQVWNRIRRLAFGETEFSEQGVDAIIDFFRDRKWTLEVDIPTQRTVQKKIQARVPDKYTHVSAGSRIIDQGEKVTIRHIAMLQAMKKALRENRNLWHPLPFVGSLILALLLSGICVVYFHSIHPNILASNRKLLLVITIVILTFGYAKVTEYFLLSSKSNLIEVMRYPLFVPFAALLLCSLTTASIASFATGFLTVILTMSLAFEQQGFMILNFVAGLITLLSVHRLHHRKEIFVVCGKAWLGCIAVIFSLHFYQSSLWSVGTFTDILNSGVFMLLTAVMVVGLLPLLETAFRIMTDVTLMEYMDPNNNLLRRLTIEAPGTYQHSIIVGNLAEAAALAIGANGLFCRVATLYHDIGKLTNPQYFTENQYGGMNIHQLLTPHESAQVIMAHVTEGISMAQKAGIPEQFIDIIREHHGTTLVYYFYRKQIEKEDDDPSRVEELEFRYSGPKPRSKESAIIMIADTLEAASRSLDPINEETISEMADRLIREKAEDGQFDQSALTFEELAIVKKTLVNAIVAFGHSRVKYPTRESLLKDKDFAPSSEA